MKNSAFSPIWARALWLSLKRFNRKAGWVMSSHIAMSMMLALFPFVLFTVALAGAVANIFSRNIDLDDLVDLVFGGWPEAVSAPILTELYAVLESSNTGLITIGGVLALYFAANGVNAVRVAMVRAYHERDTRPYWQSRLICFGFVILGGTGILFAAIFEVILPLYLHYLADFFPNVDLSFNIPLGINGLVAAVVPFVAVFLCHLVLPGQIHRLTDILPGTLLTVALWWAAGIGFAFYISAIAQYSATYAGLAGAMAAMIFLYVNAAILILGAEYNSALIDLRKTDAVQVAKTPHVS
ncbi:YihY/virulence factor BrkB family protein [Pseudophaeobacter flagellatus]|uniref:YihY/virulence factor BrkB family protein n=1 Tax=Pseudophaeobacter flagellatus TaxID=2899119 RepID=UPI001E2AED1E|nr:YihY/virulence factor BrkB family protein [Pseudophaeobacter flagellatus]MCD9147917.1 YihY/virulence factor BrkB family protein [Pseudophaeobacter flagellatus]